MSTTIIQRSNCPSATGHLTDHTSPSPHRNNHAALLGIGAVFLTGAVLWFNGSYGYTEFGVGMSAAFLGFAIVKDAGVSYAWAARGKRGRVAAGLLGLIGFVISCLAAIGAASHGRQEASDPRAAQIAAYESAAATAAEAEAALKRLGATLPPDQARARQAQVVVDAAILRRTQGCTALVHPTSTRQTDANTDACRDYQKAGEAVAAAEAAAKWQGRLDDARAVLAKGRPASADAQATSIAALLSLFTVLHGIDGIQAWTNLLIGLGLEIGSPLAWAAFAAAFSGSGWSLGRRQPAHTLPDVQDVHAALPAPSELSFSERKAAALAQAEPSQLTELFSGDLPETQTAEIVPFPGPDNSGGPKGGKRVRRERAEQAAELRQEILRLIESGETFDSQEGIRARVSHTLGRDIHRARVSEALRDLHGQVPRRVEGRRKVIG